MHRGDDSSVKPTIFLVSSTVALMRARQQNSLSPAGLAGPVQPVLEEVLAKVTEVLEAKASAISVYDPDRNEVRLRADYNLSPGVAVAERGRRGTGTSGRVIASRKPVLVEDVEADPAVAPYARAALEAGYRCVYGVPLLSQAGDLLGTLTTYYGEPRRPADSEIQLIEAYARQTAELLEQERGHAEARRAAARERRRATRQQALAELGVVLNGLDSTDAILALVTEQGRRLVGARRAAATHLPGGWERSTTVVSGWEREAVWRDAAAVPRGPGALDAVTNENRPLRLAGAELAAPEWAGLRSPGHPPLPNYLAVPLVDRDGSNLGLIQVAGKVGERRFGDEDEALLVQLAHMAAVAIEQAGLLEGEREARAGAEEQAKLRGLLADASKAFATSLEVDETLRTLARFTVPALADWCCVHLLTETGDVRLARVEVVNALAGEGIAEALGGLEVSLDRQSGPGAVIRTGRSELFPQITGNVMRGVAGGDVTAEGLPWLRASAGMIVPLRARGRTIGAYSLARSGRAYREADLEFARDLAARAALAVDNASRYAFEREVAVTLQRSLLPDALPPSAAIMVASRYLPGASGTEIGGDWYDLVALPDGRLGLIVGDVMGRGIPAAAVMAQLRAAVRAYALEGHGPAALLTRLELVVGALGEGQITTCLYGVLDPATRKLTLASAGHLPPVVIRPDGGARFPALDPNLPLGAGARRFVPATITLSPGSTVVLYTDGLVEGRDFPPDEGMARLLAAARGPILSPEELCDRLLRAMGRDGDHDDDIALLAITVSAEAEEAGSRQ